MKESSTGEQLFMTRHWWSLRCDIVVILDNITSIISVRSFNISLYHCNYVCVRD